MTDKDADKPPGTEVSEQGGGPDSETDQPAAAGPMRPAKSAEVHAYIGRQLRAVYDDVAKQPVPDRFLELMRKLDAKTGAR